jgi:hypothetical protein
MRQLVIIVALIISTAALADEPTAALADHLLDFTIVDQFDTEHTQAEFAGRVTVLLWADREGAEHTGRWKKTIARKLKQELADGTVTMRNVAHLLGVPSFIRGRVKAAFSEKSDQWVLMDWDGRFAAAYAPTPGHCNVLVFGRDGTHVHQQAVTGLEQAALDAVLAAVQAALADDGVPGPTSPVEMSPAD